MALEQNVKSVVSWRAIASKENGYVEFDAEIYV
jgi:hypothetical protein